MILYMFEDLFPICWHLYVNFHCVSCIVILFFFSVLVYCYSEPCIKSPRVRAIGGEKKKVELMTVLTLC